VIVVRQRRKRIGSARDEHAHHLDVPGLRRPEQRCRARAERRIADRMRALHDGLLERRVRIGARGKQCARDVDGRQRSHWRRRAAPVPDRQAMHVDGRVQRAHAGLGIDDIRIGAGLDEHGRKFVVRVDDRDDGRRRAVGVLGIEIGAGLDERLAGRERILTRGVHDRRPLAERQYRLPEPAACVCHRGRTRVDVRAVRHEHAHNLGMILSRRENQRRFAIPTVARFDFGAVREQRVDHGRIARARGRHQNRLALGQHGAGVGSRAQQCRHRLGEPAVGRRVQRREPIAIGRIRVAARFEQRRNERVVTGRGRPVQRRRAVGFGRVDIGALPNEGQRRVVVEGARGDQ
jgi:hypothetical protein